MKKLDKLILGSFLSPFLLTFFVVDFIFLIIYLLKYIDDLVGKGLGLAIYGELFTYFAINMVPTSLPLAILLSTLMTFGNLGEHLELTAIKSSGVSLIRALFPVFVVCILLSGISFYFNNTIVPEANLKAYSLLYDIRQKKPSLDLKEGAFYNGIPGYSIKVKKKYSDGQTLEGIIIYNHSRSRGNTEVIIADSGKMYTFNNEQYLAMELFRGKSFTEYIKDGDYLAPKEFIRNSFDKSKMVFSLASFALNNTPEQLFASNKVMKSVSRLEKDIDSMKNEKKVVQGKLVENLQPFYVYGITKQDTIKAAASVALFANPGPLVFNRAVNQARSIKNYLAHSKDRIKYFEKEVRNHQIEKWRKYTQAIACLMMFLIGAPLGAIIKKGGFGIPVLISIIFFIIFYVVSIIGEKFAKEGVWDMEYGMWLGNLVLLPLGLFFLRQAYKDSRLLQGDFYSVLFHRIRNLFSKK